MQPCKGESAGFAHFMQEPVKSRLSACRRAVCIFKPSKQILFMEVKPLHHGNCAKSPYTDPEMKQYFAALPIFIQESILQSSLKFEDLSHLQNFVDNMNRDK